MAIKRSALGFSEQSPVMIGQASVDGVFEYAGVAHPALATHMLATLGVLLVSLGDLHTGALQPLPIYGCWGALTSDDVPNSPACRGYSLLPSGPLDDRLYVWQCGRGSGWWGDLYWMSGALVVVRVVCTLIAGVCMDVHGRRRVCIATMGVYFVFSVMRAFAPVVEVSIVAVVIVGAAAEATVMGLVLIALESSVQKECLRSSCLVLLGHSLALVAVVVPVHSMVQRALWRDLIKTAPAAGFVILLCWLPESVRWVLSGGDWVDAGFLLPRTHNIQLDEVIKPKLMAVQRETERCLSSAGCHSTHNNSRNNSRNSSRSNSVRRSLWPVLCTRVARVWLIGSVCAAVYGLTTGTLVVSTLSSYNSLADRALALGAIELAVLVALALLMARLPSRALVAITMTAMALTTALTALTTITGTQLCYAVVSLSLASHGVAVSAGVSLMVSIWRLCPTHSRGALYGLVWAWAVLGFAVAAPYCDLMDSLHVSGLEKELKVYMCSGGCLFAAIIGLMLPDTPTVLPDALSHLKRSNEYDLDDSNTDNEQLENTRL